MEFRQELEGNQDAKRRFTLIPFKWEKLSGLHQGESIF